MTIKEASKIIKDNCKVSGTLPITSNCNKECEMYFNCDNRLTPCSWITTTWGGAKGALTEAMDEIKFYCRDQGDSCASCPNCDFFGNCEIDIPAFWEDITTL